MALAAALFAACGRDDGNASHSGNQQIVNELTIDGITYPMTVTALDDMLFRAIDANGQRFVLTGGIQHSDLGDDIDLTWDLTQPVEGIHFTFSLEGSLSLYLVYDNNGVKISGMLDHQAVVAALQNETGVETPGHHGIARAKENQSVVHIIIRYMG